MPKTVVAAGLRRLLKDVIPTGLFSYKHLMP